MGDLMKVKDRMTANLVVAASHTTYREAMTLLKENEISHLPVVDEQGKVVGIVSKTDLMSTGPSRVTSLSIYEIHTLLDELTLRQIMSTPALAVDESCGLANAAGFMVEHNVGSLLVMHKDELVGIITETDIFKTFVEVLGGGQPGARIEVQVADEKGMLAQATQAFADAGSYIFSLTTFQDQSGKYTLASFKETGASEERLQGEIEKRPGVELLEFHPTEQDALLRLG
jgi:acetoin utilization protein AcuB